MGAFSSNVLVGVIAAITVIITYELFIEKSKVSSQQQISGVFDAESTVNSIRNITIQAESNTKCTFVIACGKGDTDTIEEMKPLIASAILLSTCALKFILMTDKESAQRADELFRELQTTMKPVTIEIWVIAKKYIRRKAKGIKYDVYSHHSGWWGTAKLFVPWILKDAGYRRVIVLDADMLFIQDPMILWAHVDESDNDAQPWAYQMILNDMRRPATICSCIVVMDIPRIIENDFYPTKFLAALQNNSKRYDDTTGKYTASHGDQGLYYLLSQAYPQLFRSLPQRFNVDHCHDYYETLVNSSAEPVSLIHFNCAHKVLDSTGSGNKLFDFFRNYRWSWLKGYATVSYPLNIRRIKFP